jgi:hypothetical protein
MGAADLRTWLPLVAACAVFAVRETMRTEAAAVPPPARSVTLPQLQGPVAQPRKATYELDRERSSVRFLLRSNGSESLFQCPVVEGTYTTSQEDGGMHLELELDIGSLVPFGSGGTADAVQQLRDLLGVNRAETVRYHAGLVSRASTPLPGLSQLVWQGDLHFGGRTVRQAMSLWQTLLPGQPPRLQGHGTVPTDAYGIGRSAWFGLVNDHHVVTLGIDLGWQRSSAH